MAGFIDAGHTVAAVIPTPQARHRAVSDQEVRNAREAQRMRKHHVDRKAVRENDDPRASVLRRGGFVQGCEHTGAESVWLRAEIANWILQKPRPSLAALRASVSVER